MSIFLFSVVFFMQSYSVSFLPAKESLRSVFNHVLHHQRGIYLSFTQEHIKSLMTDSSLYQAVALQGENVYKSFYYPCKGAALNQSVALEHMKDSCADLSNLFCRPLGGAMGIPTPHIYSFHPLHVLSEFEHDLNYVVRFIWNLKHYVSLCITQNSISNELKNLLWGSKCVYVTTKDFATFDECVGFCVKHCPSNFSTIIFDESNESIEIAKRLYEQRVPAFFFSMGNFIDVLEKRTTLSETNVEKLKKMLSREVVILYTAALLHNNLFEFRKNEYTKTTQILNSYWYMPYVTEAIRDSADFLSNGAAFVFNSRINDAHLKNKGVNEGRSMLKALDYFKFDDESMIVKLTGRYHFKSDSFLRLIENTPDIDGYVALDPRTLFSFSGCFGLKAKYFKEMLQLIDWNQMEHQMIDLERKVLEFMRKIELERCAKIIYLEEVDIKSFVNHYFHYEW